VSAAEGDLFQVTNVYPRTSGLPMTVWMSPRGRAGHDARIEICRVPDGIELAQRLRRI
jgi:hypothetical protein